MKRQKGCFLLAAAAFLLLVPSVWSQRYSDFRVFRAADGLAESPCVSVSIGINQRVVVKHANLDSISQFDGYSVVSFPSPENGRNRVLGSSGGQLWTITSEGLEEFRDNAWHVHPIPQITNHFHGMTAAAMIPIPIRVIKQGRVLILLPDQLLEFSVENRDVPRLSVLRTADHSGLVKFTGMVIANDGSLWLAGRRGLAHVPGLARNMTPESAWQDYLAPPDLQAENFQEPLGDVDGSGITCAADSSSGETKLVVHFDGRNWTQQPVVTEKIRGAWRAREGVTWVVSVNSLLQIDNCGTPAAEIEEIFAGHYFDVAVETNGIFWIASAEGLLRYSPPLWKPPRAIQRLNLSLPVLCLAEDSQSRLWFACAGALYSFDGEQPQEHIFPAQYRRSLQSTRMLLPLKNGDLLFDTGEQLFQFQPGSDSLNLLASPGGRKHALGVFRDGSIAVQSIDPATQTTRLEKYDGISFLAFPSSPPGGSYSAILETQNGDLWLGGDSGAVCLHDKQWQNFSSSSVPHGIVSFIETGDGKIWCATADSIWEFDGQIWTALHGGFDQINSFIRTHDGNVWVASNGGLHRFVQGAWVENNIEEGLPIATARQIYEDHRGNLWLGTSRGLTLFHPDADTDPARTRIRIQSGQDTIPEGANISLIFTGHDKWKFTPAERLLYSYRLDQHDWSQYLENNGVSFSDLAPGPHSFEVRSMDRNGNVELRQAQLPFTVELPWYRETRLVIISFCGMLAALFFAGLAFNRHRRLLLSYAEVERKVAERTHELEMTSRELVHSQKMNALGTLAAGVAHDFNNILSIIKGSAQIIEDNVQDSEKIRTRVDRIKTVVEQGAGIVRAMLGFSSGSSEEPVPCDINAVVTETIQLLGDRFQRDAAIIFKADSNLPPVPVVKEFVQQILLNFIFNAAEAETAAKRKQIIVTTRPEQGLPRLLALSPALASGFVTVSVQDFGSGISPENLPRIFEPFFTTKAFSARRGTGLGLSMVYELAKKMEAGIAVESTQNVGSTFTLILPVSELKPHSTANEH